MIPVSVATYFLTGASSGIGESLARELVRRGHRVALASRSADRLSELREQLCAKGDEALAFPLDVRDAAAVSDAVGKTVDSWGQIDVAIANAGIGFPTPARKFSLEDARSIMQTNFDGMLTLFAATIPAMVERQAGQFVGIASVAGLRGLPGASMYSASKAAMQTFLEASRIELKRQGVAVTVVNPGFIATPMTEKNKYPMPFIMSAGRAASIIAGGIESRRRTVEFPLPMSLVMRTARLLPAFVWERLAAPYSKRKVQMEKARR